jgi:hypothetical protein
MYTKVHIDRVLGFFSSRRVGTPHPLTRCECVPFLFGLGGGAHSLEGEGVGAWGPGGVPIRTRVQTLLYSILGFLILCGVHIRFLILCGVQYIQYSRPSFTAVQYTRIIA